MKTTQAAKPAPKRSIMILAAAIAVIVIAAAVTVILIVTGAKPAETVQPTEATTNSELILSGEPARADLLVGSWVSYFSGKRIVYVYDDDGCADFSDEDGATHYHYKTEGDHLIQTSDTSHQVYIWTPAAKTFIADHSYGEARNIIALAGEQIEDLYGYVYVEGDYLYLGKLIFCREERLVDDGNNSLVGSWTGAAGDRLAFDADGAYHYREESYDYHGTYQLSEDGKELTLQMEGQSGSVLLDGEWEVSGRILRSRNRYYFRDEG